MKKKAPIVRNIPKDKPVHRRKYSKEDMDALINAILDGTDDTEEMLSARLGRNRGYIAQTRSRNSVTERLIQTLQVELEKKTARSKADPTVDEAVMMRATVTYLIRELAILKSKQQNRPVREVLDESEQSIQIILRDIQHN